MSYVERYMTKELSEHVLEEVSAPGDKIQAYYLRRPGEGRMMSTLVLFTPEGIVLMGDLCPDRGGTHGVVSNFGYGLGWFTGQLSEGYLCSKFLHEVWQRDAALKDCRYQVHQHLQDARAQELGSAERKADRKRAKAWREILQDLEHEVIFSSESMYNAMNEHDLYDGEYVPGYDYGWTDAGWLCAIQRRFSELWHAKIGRPV